MALPLPATFVAIAVIALIVVLLALRARRAGHLPPVAAWAVMGVALLAIIALFVWPILPFVDRRLDDGVPMRDAPSGMAVPNPAGPATSAPAQRGETAGSPQMANYIAQVQAADLFAIQSGSLAARRGHTPAVREMGERLVREHGASAQSLGRLAKSAGLALPPPALSPAQSRQLALMDRTTGPAFDALWRRVQIEAHDTALADHTRAARTLPPGQLVAFAKALAQKTTSRREELASASRSDAAR